MKHSTLFTLMILLLSACSQAPFNIPSRNGTQPTSVLKLSEPLRVSLVPSSYAQSLKIVVARDGAVYQDNGEGVRYYNSKWTITPPWTDPQCNEFPPPNGIDCPFTGDSGIAVAPSSVAYWNYLYQVVGSLKVDGYLQIGANGNMPQAVGTEQNGVGDMDFDPYGRLWIAGVDFGDDEDLTIMNEDGGIIKSGNNLPDWINALAWGPNRNMWGAGLTNYGTGPAVVDQLTNASIQKRYTISNSKDIEGITTGGDGALWFTDRTNNAIDRITVGGKFTSYSVPTPNANLGKILAASNGNLWFTESATNQIGQITTQGQISEYPLPSGVAYPYGIAQQPKCSTCRIWFSYSGGFGWFKP